MSVEVVMPQMGESITEGTVSKWLKQIGDKIERDEPILEISTDKVDAEVPSPAEGVLLEIRVNEGTTVEVGSVVAVIGAEGETAQQATTPTPTAEPTQAERTAEMLADGDINVNQSESATVSETTAPTSQALPENIADQTSNALANNDTSGATEVVMPQMGESITEGTVSKWLKQVGDKIERDEPLLEISTDKVDAEVPSPAEGVLLEIRASEGTTVEVGTVVALVGASGATAAPPSQTSKVAEQKAVEATAEATGADAAEAHRNATAKETFQESIQETEGRSYDYGRPGAVADAQKPLGESASAILPSADSVKTSDAEASVDELRRSKSSPLVRNIAKEHGIDISRVSGSGMSGRVTKKDILTFIESGAALSPQQALANKQSVAPLPVTAPVVSAPSAPSASVVTLPTPPVSAPQTVSVPQTSAGDRIEPMSVMRKKIAEHMTFSKQTSAHVTSVYEIDMTNIVKFREKNKKNFQERYGTKLTFMPFIFQAVTSGLRKFPVINAQVAGEQIVYKGDVNLGMAVALDWGLIVPVIKRADQLSLSGLAIAANDLADRARTKKLAPDEVAGGTFTITNPGVFGGLFGTPIINQPQVAILCVGTIEKRAKVITTADGDDTIAIRSMAYFALTYDHRIIDGSDAEKFLSYLKETLENGQFSI